MAQKLPNKLGVFDMLRNVSEWVANIDERLVELPRGVTAAQQMNAGLRIMRGGGYVDYHVVAAGRKGGKTILRWDAVGFRCAAN